jgi:transcription termination factor Rho
LSAEEATIATIEDTRPTEDAHSTAVEGGDVAEKPKPARTRRKASTTPRKTRAKAAGDVAAEEVSAPSVAVEQETTATAAGAEQSSEGSSPQVDSSPQPDADSIPNEESVVADEGRADTAPLVATNGIAEHSATNGAADLATSARQPDQEVEQAPSRREERGRGPRGRDGSRGGQQDRANRRDRNRGDGRQDARQSRRDQQHRAGNRDRSGTTVDGARSDNGAARSPAVNGPSSSTYVQPKSSTNPDHISVSDLNAKSLEELYDVAAKFEIAGGRRIKRPELTIRILRAQSEAEGDIFGDGVLEIIEDGFGFLRGQRFLPSPDDIYVSQSQIRRFALRTGDRISGQVRPPKDNEKFFSLLRVEAVNGVDPEVARRRPRFDSLTPIFPLERIDLETAPNILSTRLLDLVAPIGRGQRGLIVSPPKAGKTMLLKSIANGITANNNDMHLMVCLIGERPEEVTDMRRSIDGDVISSTFDEPVEDHTKVAEMALERAKRLVEGGNDVTILLDSITRLARAYNLAVPPSGRTLSGGMDPIALYPPKRFFGAARNIEGGGSLTIVSTCLVDTGSRMDDVIYEEFKGTGNMELHLDRKLAERRIYPSIDIQRSGTRREELLLDENELRQVWTMRRMVSMLGGSEGTELVLSRLAKTQANKEFLETLNRDV